MAQGALQMNSRLHVVDDKPLHILIVDDDATNIVVMEKTLHAHGYRITSLTSGEEACARIDDLKPDVILLDVMMPGLNGFEVCRRIKLNLATRLIPVILITALQEREDRITGIEAGCDDFISKPIDRVELIARVRALGKNKRLNDELDDAESVIMSFARAVEAKDGTTGDHCDRLIRLSKAFGLYLGLSGQEIRTLNKASILHDVGKIGVPDAILLKPGKLTKKEWDVMKQHPQIGEEICRPLRSLHDVLPIIRHHHEKWNGTGYPDGLKQDAIPPLARIFQIIDAYDAMTTVRPYKTAFSAEETLKILCEESQRGLWDPNIAEKFVDFIEEHRGEFSVNG